MTKHASLAEYYRAHREAFELALELGITPRSAGILLRERARKRRRACGTMAPAQPADTDFEPMDAPVTDYREWPARWMMRD